VGFAPGWLVFDVTTGVQAMSSGQANYGWRLLGVSGNANEKQFASSEYATQSLRPSLVITYATGSNAPPTVSITSPANGTVFAAGSTVTVDATAQDSDGSVAKVDFYRDGVLAGTDTTAPYSLPLTGLTSGTHVLTAVATDNAGATATSAAVTITINAAPSVSITSPTSGASFTQGTPVTVDATASDPDGSVAKVDFYSDGVLVGTDATAPYSASVSGLTLGSHTLQAVATDNVGATATASVSITVVTAGSGGTVTFQDGLNGYTGTRDTYLSGWSVNENNANATTLYSSGAYTDLVRFAVFASEGGPVPNGATITSAQLSLYKTSSYDYVFQARRMLKDWVEGEATWNRPRIGATWTVAGAGGSGTDYASVVDATAAVGFAPGWLAFDVTTGVQAMSSGQVNYGWRLLGVSGNSNEKQFASSEYATQSLRPKLTISYTP